MPCVSWTGGFAKAKCRPTRPKAKGGPAPRPWPSLEPKHRMCEDHPAKRDLEGAELDAERERERPRNAWQRPDFYFVLAA